MYQILVCDDEKEIVQAVKLYLEAEGYRVFSAYDGEAALEMLKKEDIHLVLLDVMMPKLDGISAARRIREISAVPILMVSAKSEDADKILGLNMGADDYITKPFNPLELVARVRSNLRRYTALPGIARHNLLQIGGLVIDDDRKQVTVEGEPVRLTPLEYNLLLFLAENKGRVFSIAQLYENVWKEPFDGAEKKVVVHISHLREKLEINPKDPRYIKSVWGLGYKMEDIR